MDLPTATDPGDADDEGGGMGVGFAQERVALGGGAAAPVDVELEKGRQGAGKSCHLGHVDGVA